MGLICDAAISLRALRGVVRKFNNMRAMYLRQKHGLRVHGLLKNGAISGHIRRLIAHMVAQVERVERRHRRAPGACRTQRMNPLGRGPLGDEPVGVQSQTAT